MDETWEISETETPAPDDRHPCPRLQLRPRLDGRAKTASIVERRRGQESSRLRREVTKAARRIRARAGEDRTFDNDGTLWAEQPLYFSSSSCSTA